MKGTILLLKLADALEVSLGEMCEFDAKGLDPKQAQSALRDILKGADTERLRTAIRVLKAILR